MSCFIIASEASAILMVFVIHLLAHELDAGCAEHLTCLKQVCLTYLVLRQQLIVQTRWCKCCPHDEHIIITIPHVDDSLQGAESLARYIISGTQQQWTKRSGARLP
eukprot:TRINITY_DN1578_c0_g1_i3.p2 TRINITY_DN1578_c0_g1~~TRINITY_DN1578_c0_g1_i3.p2  ORF type:complete len:106 (-),score=6.42 TRINITY_DN1578_c0_g1_i3:293-610(-)